MNWIAIIFNIPPLLDDQQLQNVIFSFYETSTVLATLACELLSTDFFKIK